MQHVSPLFRLYPPPPRISYALVQATVGVGTVLIWDFGVAYTRGGGDMFCLWVSSRHNTGQWQEVHRRLAFDVKKSTSQNTFKSPKRDMHRCCLACIAQHKEHVLRLCHPQNQKLWYCKCCAVERTRCTPPSRNKITICH